MTEQLTQTTNEQTENTVQKQRTVKEMLAILKEHFPKVFVSEKPYSPLKVGIYKDIKEYFKTCDSIEGEISLKEIRGAISVYCRNWHYFESCTSGAARLDLNGEECGVVTAEEAAYALETLTKSKEAVKERMKAVKKEQKFTKDGESKKAKPRAVKNFKNIKSTKKPVKVVPKVESVNIETLKAGDSVKALVGSKYQNATLVELNKDLAIVELFGGMRISLNTDKLFK